MSEEEAKPKKEKFVVVKIHGAKLRYAKVLMDSYGALYEIQGKTGDFYKILIREKDLFCIYQYIGKSPKGTKPKGENKKSVSPLIYILVISMLLLFLLIVLRS